MVNLELAYVFLRMGGVMKKGSDYLTEAGLALAYGDLAKAIEEHDEK